MVSDIDEDLNKYESLIPSCYFLGGGVGNQVDLFFEEVLGIEPQDLIAC